MTEPTGDDRELLHGGTGVPADRPQADADHPGMPAGGDLGDDTPPLAEDEPAEGSQIAPG